MTALAKWINAGLVVAGILIVVALCYAVAIIGLSLADYPVIAGGLGAFAVLANVAWIAMGIGDRDE